MRLASKISPLHKKCSLKAKSMASSSSNHLLNFLMGGKKYPGWKIVINVQAIPIILHRIGQRIEGLETRILTSRPITGIRSPASSTHCPIRQLYLALVLGNAKQYDRRRIRKGESSQRESGKTHPSRICQLLSDFPKDRDRTDFWYTIDTPRDNCHVGESN